MNNPATQLHRLVSTINKLSRVLGVAALLAAGLLIYKNQPAGYLMIGIATGLFIPYLRD